MGLGIKITGAASFLPMASACIGTIVAYAIAQCIVPPVIRQGIAAIVISYKTAGISTCAGATGGIAVDDDARGYIIPDKATNITSTPAYITCRIAIGNAA